MSRDDENPCKGSPDVGGIATLGRPVTGGRDVGSLGRAQRALVWEITDAHWVSAAVEGLVDFGEVCGIAATLLDDAAARGGQRPADHVLVDEGQDLTAAL